MLTNRYVWMLMDRDELTKMRKDTSRWQMTEQKTIKAHSNNNNNKTHKYTIIGKDKKTIMMACCSCWKRWKDEMVRECSKIEQTEKKIMRITLRMHMSIAHGSFWSDFSRFYFVFFNFQHFCLCMCVRSFYWLEWQRSCETKWMHGGVSQSNTQKRKIKANCADPRVSNLKFIWIANRR